MDGQVPNEHVARRLRHLGCRVSTAAEALHGSLQSGQRVFVATACGKPRALVEAMVAQASRLHAVEVVHAHTEGEAAYVAPGMEPHFRHRALFVAANTRAAVQAGRADMAPIFLSDVPALFASGDLPLDLALIGVSPPDAHGFCSLGLSVDITKAAAECARVVVAQVNARLPRTLGDSFIHVSRIHHAVPIDEEPYTIIPSPPTAEQVAIGAQVASLVEDGSTVQMGIGAIPDAVLGALSDKRDLGVHTEMFSDGVMELARAGVITGARKTIHRGKVVAGFVMGSRALYDWVDDNPEVEMHPIEYVNDTRVILQNPRMVAINAALQVDLTGQVCADLLGHRAYSGVGGQMDFMRGAALSPGGKPIIALPATARGGTVSRIVSALSAGAGVTTTRAHVHYIVTEYGVAHLWGKSVRERAAALIAIAHPAFRDDLAHRARELQLL